MCGIKSIYKLVIISFFSLSPLTQNALKQLANLFATYFISFFIY
jgi:hypothetical protein